MRLWSIDLKYLDSKGLVALWRETLLAKNVLEGRTVGYKNHPQLKRFKENSDSVSVINSYLLTIFNESQNRGFNFNRDKIGNINSIDQIDVTKGQLEYEFYHLQKKLILRDIKRYKINSEVNTVEPNSFFREVEGDIEEWEII